MLGYIILVLCLCFFFFFSSRRRHTRCSRDWSSDVCSSDLYSPWHRVDGWRLNEESHHDFVFMDGEARHPVRVRFTDDGQRLLIGARDYRIEGDGPLIRLDGRSFKARAVRDGSQWHVFCNGGYRRLALKAELQAPGDAAARGSLAAPLPREGV